MIKRIPIRALKVGMYISDLNVDWIPHANLQKKGRVPNEAVIQKIAALGVRDLYIDTFKGKDTEDGLTQAEVDAINEEKLRKMGGLAPWSVHVSPSTKK